MKKLGGGLECVLPSPSIKAVGQLILGPRHIVFLMFYGFCANLGNPKIPDLFAEGRPGLT